MRPLIHPDVAEAQCPWCGEEYEWKLQFNSRIGPFYEATCCPQARYVHPIGSDIMLQPLPGDYEPEVMT